MKIEAQIDNESNEGVLVFRNAEDELRLAVVETDNHGDAKLSIDFSAHSRSERVSFLIDVWVDPSGFMKAMKKLDGDLSTPARLQSLSPEEFDFTLAHVGRGLISATHTIQDPRFEETTLTYRFSHTFTFDQTFLPVLIAAWQTAIEPRLSNSTLATS